MIKYKNDKVISIEQKKHLIKYSIYLRWKKISLNNWLQGGTY